jgi:hypothetical protein
MTEPKTPSAGDDGAPQAHTPRIAACEGLILPLAFNCKH